jgi:ABC-2 type transport system ATP-binding protein
MKRVLFALFALAGLSNGLLRLPETSGEVQGAFRFASGIRIVVQFAKPATSGWHLALLRIDRRTSGTPSASISVWNSVLQLSVDRLRIRCEGNPGKIAIMLELRNVSKHFSSIPAVDDVTFAARPGEVTGYLGPNGSGKSTTMKMITGLIEMTFGHILFQGKPIQDDPIAYRRRMGYVPEEPYLYNHLSGAEYLTMVAQLRNLPTRQSSERIDGMLRLLSLYDDRHASISGYSKGMRQKVLIVAALMHNPELILLDEPFSGLDVASSLVLRGLIQELAARGKVVLFSSHELDTVERVCSRVVILHRGKLVADDSIERLRSLMELPTLEAIFSQLAVEQDTDSIARQIADLIHA